MAAPRPSLALRTIAERTGFKGDAKLADLTTKAPAPNAYFHSGHGAEDMYEGNVYNDAIVPKGCVYVTSVECGHISFVENARATEFLRQWHAAQKEKDIHDMFKNISLTTAAGKEARDQVEGIFAIKSANDKPYDSNMVEFSLAKESFVNGLVMPILSWHLRPLPATETRPARPERYYTKPSGLQPVGADLLTPIEIEDGVITKDHIQAIYKDSLFPTAKELLEDNVLKHVLGNKFKNDKTGILESNYRMVVDYINEEWVSSSIALMNAFPGAHYHLICRVPMNNSQHAKLRIAPKRKAKESGRAKIKANVTKRRSTTKLAESMIPKLLRGDDWEKLEWRRFGNSFNKFASKEELPPIYPPLMGRKDGPMSWSETQRQWAMKELQIMKHKELKEKGKLPKKKKRKTKKKSRRNY